MNIRDRIKITLQSIGNPALDTTVNVRPRIRLQLSVNGTAIGPRGLSAYQVAVANGFIGTELQWLASIAGLPVLTGEKRSGYDAGIYTQLSITDDYEYRCVVEGTGEPDGSGTSIWKKKPLFQT
jgi:hypothetical protein